MASPTPLSLFPSCMAVPVYVAEEVAVGRSVFQHFLHEEFDEEGLPQEILEEAEEIEREEEIASSSHATSSRFEDDNIASAIQEGFNTNAIAKQIGANIRRIANDFSKSQERKRIKREADKVDVTIITEGGFYALCEEVFLHGINRVNIVSLFCFLSDLLKKSARSEMREIAIRLFKWALQYVLDRVCSWVARHGGWEKAIKNTFTVGQIAAMGAGAMLIVAASGFILYKISS